MLPGEEQHPLAISARTSARPGVDDDAECVEPSSPSPTTNLVSDQFTGLHGITVPGDVARQPGAARGRARTADRVAAHATRDCQADERVPSVRADAADVVSDGAGGALRLALLVDVGAAEAVDRVDVAPRDRLGLRVDTQRLAGLPGLTRPADVIVGEGVSEHDVDRGMSRRLLNLR